jgi:hypothetical protein
MTSVGMLNILQELSLRASTLKYGTSAVVVEICETEIASFRSNEVVYKCKMTAFV